MSTIPKKVQKTFLKWKKQQTSEDRNCFVEIKMKKKNNSQSKKRMKQKYRWL